MKDLNAQGLIGLAWLRELCRGSITKDQTCAIVTDIGNGYQIRFIRRDELEGVPIIGELNYDKCWEYV